MKILILKKFDDVINFIKEKNLVINKLWVVWNYNCQWKTVQKSYPILDSFSNLELNLIEIYVESTHWKNMISVDYL